jgi:hypothetical protein
MKLAVPLAGSNSTNQHTFSEAGHMYAGEGGWPEGGISD